MNDNYNDIEAFVSSMEQKVKDMSESNVNVVRKNYAHFEKLYELHKSNPNLAQAVGQTAGEQVALLLLSKGVCNSEGGALSINQVHNLMSRVRKERTVKLRANEDGKLDLTGVTLTVPKVAKPSKTPVVAPEPVAVVPTPAPEVKRAQLTPKPNPELKYGFIPVIVPGVEPIEITDWKLHGQRVKDEVKIKDSVPLVWTGEDQFMHEAIYTAAQNYRLRLPSEIYKLEAKLENVWMGEAINAVFEKTIYIKRQ
ncbi:hypothetical protein [Diaphorobacter aerolatus]|uniref:Uncharacterized protein n=1 Tax=Diaphorobacter aerolatus TaxID=1288495 RepID=A0A7H0GJB9_9BURK|nr:hypothetical protein [Diaphorobacter aerolatus]QNP48385.1 hypothetical protein H9K75_20920 [Diaphorobacter aerolatus]